MIYIGGLETIYYNNLEDKSVLFVSKEKSGDILAARKIRITRRYFIFHLKIAIIIEYLISFLSKKFHMNILWSYVVGCGHGMSK